MRRLYLVVLSMGVASSTVLGQSDPLEAANRSIREGTGQILSFTLEERTRWEEKYGVSFGKAVNQQDMLSRLRIGAQFQPTSWLRVYAMGQDSRVPFYGLAAPNTMRDTMDLQEAYAELFGNHKTGFTASFGRQMLDYGETRLIGSPQWSNVSRTYDFGRMGYRTPKARFELLLVSPVKILPDAFNKPEFGERIFGTYDVLPSVWRKSSVDVYVLRHSQNKIGGWTGAGTLGTNSFGGRWYGPLPYKLAYSFEGIGQTGHLGLSTQRAFAFFGGLSREATVVRRQVRFSGEYKVASGTQAGTRHSGTFDQLSPSNHDKYGHEDLFGWRNLKTLKSLETLNISKAFALNFMYTNDWLYSATDSLYSSQGTSLAISKKGTAGTHVGQETDAFVTYKHQHHTFGAGFGHFFKGEFVANATSHINPRYFYVFQQYTLK